jgi:cation transport protein ChaC
MIAIKRAANLRKAGDSYEGARVAPGGPYRYERDGGKATNSPMQDISHWVFGYGSLMWRPGFASSSRQQAMMPGVHRRLCVYSYRHRGTEARPGLVFGLVHGGSCRGMAFEVRDADWTETQAYLSEREMDRGVYREAVRPMVLADGRRVEALVFLVDEGHPQFAGRLTVEEQVRIVRAGVGESGANPEYVLETARHLQALGIRDRGLDEVVAAL